jgi:hypothetical protein
MVRLDRDMAAANSGEIATTISHRQFVTQGPANGITCVKKWRCEMVAACSGENAAGTSHCHFVTQGLANGSALYDEWFEPRGSWSPPW